jgi:hypothetical protein
MRIRFAVAPFVMALGCGFQSAEIRAHDLSGDTVEAPEGLESTEQGLGTSGSAVLFLSFDALTISNGSSNARANTSFIVPAGPAVTIPAFDETQFGVSRADAMAEIAAQVRADFAAFDLELVTARPATGAYTLVAIGGSPALLNLGATVAGIAPVDRNNANRRDVAFVFSEELFTLKAVANCISHEVGHTFGLSHLSPQDDLMYPMLQPGQGRWQKATIFGSTLEQDEPGILSGLFGAPDAGTAPAPNALNEWPYGTLESLDAETIHGWAFDPDAPAKSLSVQLYVNGRWVKNVTANEPRTDLADKGVSGDAHGFSTTLMLTPGQTVRAYAVDDLGRTAVPLDGKLLVP